MGWRNRLIDLLETQGAPAANVTRLLDSEHARQLGMADVQVKTVERTLHVEELAPGAEVAERADRLQRRRAVADDDVNLAQLRQPLDQILPAGRVQLGSMPARYLGNGSEFCA